MTDLHGDHDHEYELPVDPPLFLIAIPALFAIPILVFIGAVQVVRWVL